MKKNKYEEKDLSKRDAILKTLEELEHKNDETTHRIFIELGRNFITPLDREDIHLLITRMDDILAENYASNNRL